MTRCRAGRSWAACSLELFAGVYIGDETCLLKAFNFALACARIFYLMRAPLKGIISSLSLSAV